MPPAGVTFRPVVEPDDMAFLEDLYASGRELEMAQVPWSTDERRAFLAQQFAWQHRAYSMLDAERLVIMADDIPAGRLYLSRMPDEIRIVDIALMPQFRGRGIGGALLRETQDEARIAGKMLSIHVEKSNPARRLYDRLGFIKEADREVYDFMVWRHTSTQAASTEKATRMDTDAGLRRLTDGGDGPPSVRHGRA